MVLHNTDKSPNWNKYDVTDLQKYCDNNGMINGYPFDEGFPDMAVGVTYALILRNGERTYATVDFSTQYKSEGLQWKAQTSTRIYNKGNSIDRCVVAAWQEIKK